MARPATWLGTVSLSNRRLSRFSRKSCKSRANNEIRFSPRSDAFKCKVPPFDPLPGPGRFAEKRETRFHAGIVEETADRDAAPHLDPPILLDEFRDDGL